MVKFMGWNLLPRAKQQAVPLRLEGEIPKPPQLTGRIAHAGQRLHHGPRNLLLRLQLLLQIQKSSTFRHRGHAVPKGSPDGTADSRLSEQRLGIYFRIAAAQIEAVHLWERVRLQGAEKNQLRPGVPKGIQVIRIVKTKGRIPRHADGTAVPWSEPSWAVLNGCFLCFLRQCP